MTPDPEMGAFWDKRARENAAYFIDNRIDYGDPDLEHFWATGSEAITAVLEPLGVEIGAQERLLEIGCGMGRLTRVLAEHAAAVTALDVSQEMIARAREHNAGVVENVTWVVGDGTTLGGVEDGSVDGCFSHVVFQHIPDPQITLGYIREIGRVLAPGGWAAFQISNDPGIHRFPGGLKGLKLRAQARLGRAPKGQSDPAWVGSAVALEDLRAAASDGGMSVERVLGEGTQFCYVRLARNV
jgi:SAM-dependent methyltransferase